MIACCFGIAVAALLIPQLLVDPPEWMRALTRIFSSGSSEQASAQNTWQARISAWDLLIQFTLSSPERAVWGSGAGSHPILASGALPYLSGNEAVRAAHNFVVTWFALFGLIGVIVTVAVLLYWFLRGLSNARALRGDAGVGIALACGVAVAGTAGVILESPFGYMTFVFGLTLSMVRVERTSEQSSTDTFTIATAKAKRRLGAR